MPKGAIQSRTDFPDNGQPGYGGPCPPTIDPPHHYEITIYAVDVDKLPNAKTIKASGADVGFDLRFHALASGKLTGLYGRGGPPEAPGGKPGR
jgi:Raf kinase inhibitor-like YbhB/YbcL family protein